MSSSSSSAKKLFLPLSKDGLSTGFPSPAENYIEHGIDLNEYLIPNPLSTFFFRISGNSMNNSGIFNDDILIVDRSINPRPRQTVVAVLDGNFVLKKLIKEQGILFLKSNNPKHPSIDLSNHINVQIWGVATYSIHKIKYSS